jgi:hypothetical protein
VTREVSDDLYGALMCRIKDLYNAYKSHDPLPLDSLFSTAERLHDWQAGYWAGIERGEANMEESVELPRMPARDWRLPLRPTGGILVDTINAGRPKPF